MPPSLLERRGDSQADTPAATGPRARPRSGRRPRRRSALGAEVPRPGRAGAVGRVEALGHKVRGASHGCCCCWHRGYPRSSALALDLICRNKILGSDMTTGLRLQASAPVKGRIRRSLSSPCVWPCVWNSENFAAGFGGVVHLLSACRMSVDARCCAPADSNGSCKSGYETFFYTHTPYHSSRFSSKFLK